MSTYHVKAAPGAAILKIAHVSLRMSFALPDKQSQLNCGSTVAGGSSQTNNLNINDAMEKVSQALCAAALGMPEHLRIALPSKSQMFQHLS